MTQTLLPLAAPLVPKGSTPEAVVDQWLQAIAVGGELFSMDEGDGCDVLEKKVLEALHEQKLPSSREEIYETVFGDISLKPDRKPSFRFIDLFAGIGGMRIGFQKAGGACVFSSEFNPPAQDTYRDNYGEMPFGDITMIDPSKIPAHDVLLAGFPCQPFSHAGLKKGIDDTRGTLFYNIASILAAKKPDFALLENVRGLISHDKGRTLKIVLQTLTQIGYECNIPDDVIQHGLDRQIQEYAKEMVLKSVDFGVPQNRQRIYIVLWRKGLLREFKYPVPPCVPTRVGDILEKSPDPRLTISDRLWEGHQRRKVENALNGKGFGYGLVTADSPYTNTISARYYKDGSEILIAQDGKNPRKLSPREAARLQGFPDVFRPNRSNVQAYKQFGNSVSVPVLAALAQSIKEQMNGT